jgi:hypothetical protein
MYIYTIYLPEKSPTFLKIVLAVLEILHAERHQVRHTRRRNACIFKLSVENILKARIRLNFRDISLKEANTKSHIIELAPHTHTHTRTYVRTRTHTHTHTLKRSQYRLPPESRLLESLPFRFCSDPRFSISSYIQGGEKCRKRIPALPDVPVMEPRIRNGQDRLGQE